MFLYNHVDTESVSETMAANSCIVLNFFTAETCTYEQYVYKTADIHHALVSGLF